MYKWISNINYIVFNWLWYGSGSNSSRKRGNLRRIVIEESSSDDDEISGDDEDIPGGDEGLSCDPTVISIDPAIRIDLIHKTSAEGTADELAALQRRILDMGATKLEAFMALGHKRVSQDDDIWSGDEAVDW